MGERTENPGRPRGDVLMDLGEAFLIGALAGAPAIFLGMAIGEQRARKVVGPEMYDRLKKRASQ